MLVATSLALGAAVLHAGWNLAIKQGAGEDRFLLLWGQFFMAAVMCLPIIVVFGHFSVSFLGHLPAHAWWWVALSGSVHLPYCIFLAKAYSIGDFSLVYPVARGGGAMLAAIGGVVLLHDSLSFISALGIAVVCVGLIGLAGRIDMPSLTPALIVAVTIGVYSVSDAQGNRTTHSLLYALATHIGTAASTTAYALVQGRATEMKRILVARRRRLSLAGLASTITYAMVQYAFRLAPVGHVTALRECSVLIAAFAGWKTFGEKAGRRRIAAACVVLVGLVGVAVGKDQKITTKPKVAVSNKLRK